jgi:hypothetical protein
MHDRLRSHSSPAPAQGQGRPRRADFDSRRLELRQAEPRRRAHTPLCLRVTYGADTPFADAAALSRALHLFQAGIGLPSPTLIDAGGAIMAIWRLAAGIPAPLSEHCVWQLQWLWGAFKLERQEAGGQPLYNLPPDPVLPAQAGEVLPVKLACAQPVVLAAGDGPQPPGLIASRLEAAEDAAIEAAYHRAIAIDPRPLSW